MGPQLRLFLAAVLAVVGICGTALAEVDPAIERLLQLEDGAITDTDISQANCLSASPSDAAIAAVLQSIRSSEPSIENAALDGWTIQKDSHSLIEAARTLLGRNSKPTQNCPDVVCALDARFGAGIGSRLLYLRVRYGYNASPLAFPDEADPWTLTELEDILSALGDFPQHLLPAVRDGRLLRILKKTGKPANSRIQLSGDWTELPRPRRRYVIFHEVAHQLAGLANLDTHLEWLKLTNWKASPGVSAPLPTLKTHWQENPSVDFVSSYAALNPAEDFAESAAVYRYLPQRLRSKSLKKYLFFKNVVFDGLDYADSACERAPLGTSQKILQKLKPPVSPPKAPSPHWRRATLLSACSPHYFTEVQNLVLTQKPSETDLQRPFTHCLNQELAAEEALRLASRADTVFGRSGVQSLAPWHAGRQLNSLWNTTQRSVLQSGDWLSTEEVRHFELQLLQQGYATMREKTGRRGSRYPALYFSHLCPALGLPEFCELVHQNENLLKLLEKSFPE